MVLNTFLASGNVFFLMITIANSLYPDQDQKILNWIQTYWHSDSVPERMFRKKAANRSTFLSDIIVILKFKVMSPCFVAFQHTQELLEYINKGITVFKIFIWGGISSDVWSEI